MINIIKKILKGENISLEELNKFVTGYIEKKQNKIVTSSELVQIVEMLKNGMFNIQYAAKEYARLLNYQYYELVDLKKNLILKKDIYEL